MAYWQGASGANVNADAWSDVGLSLPGSFVGSLRTKKGRRVGGLS